HWGAGDIFVAECDESDGSFLNFAPEVAVVTNVEADHLDHYHTAEAYAASFVDFLGRIQPGGVLIACADDAGAAAFAHHAEASGIRVRRYGRAATDNSDARILAYTPTGTGGQVRIRLAGAELAVSIPMPGEHMAFNAVAALLAGVELGAPVPDLLAGL